MDCAIYLYGFDSRNMSLLTEFLLIALAFGYRYVVPIGTNFKHFDIFMVQNSGGS